MKTVSMEEFRSRLDEVLEETVRGDVVLTRDGKPWLVIRAVAEDLDRDSTAFANSQALLFSQEAESRLHWRRLTRTPFPCC